MALRHSEESEHRLRPEEARAFLQVHAEREAADAPTVEDLAETLGLSSDEAQAILREARSRVQTSSVQPKTPTKKRAVPLFLVFLSLAVASSGLLVARALTRTAPENAKVWIPRDHGPLPMRASVVPQDTVMTPPNGFDVSVQTKTTAFEAGGPPVNDGTDYGQLSPPQIKMVQARLVLSVVDLLRSHVPEAQWNDLGTITLAVNVEGGPRTNLVVPITPSAPGEEREALRGSMTAVVEAAWPQIVRR